MYYLGKHMSTTYQLLIQESTKMYQPAAKITITHSRTTRDRYITFLIWKIDGYTECSTQTTFSLLSFLARKVIGL
jgi:hypothetical protein